MDMLFQGSHNDKVEKICMTYWAFTTWDNMLYKYSGEKNISAQSLTWCVAVLLCITYGNGIENYLEKIFYTVEESIQCPKAERIFELEY